MPVAFTRSASSSSPPSNSNSSNNSSSPISSTIKRNVGTEAGAIANTNAHSPSINSNSNISDIIGMEFQYPSTPKQKLQSISPDDLETLEGWYENIRLRVSLNFTRHLYETTTRLNQEVKNEKDRVVETERKVSETERRLNGEVKDGKDKFAATKSELEKAIVNLERANHFYLVATDRLNIRGALEAIMERSKTKTHNQSTNIGKDTTTTEYQPLMDIYKEPKFNTMLHAAMKTNNQTDEKTVRRCFGGLYHAVSKHVHGTRPGLTIHENDWASAEVFLL